MLLTAVGDAVHALPLLRSLKTAWPGTRITWIIQRGPFGLVAGHPDVDEFLLFDRAKGLRGYLELREMLRGREFDLVLTLQDYLKAALITALLPSARKVGLGRGRARDLTWLFHNEPIQQGEIGHIQDQYLDFLHHLGVPPVLEWRIGPTSEERSRYSGPLQGTDRPRVALVAGTSRPEKEWPAERYVELADRLIEQFDAELVIIGGRSDREEAVARAIVAGVRAPVLDLREWDLRRLVYLINGSDVLVTPDTGPMHIGVALATPTVALMGHTNPARYGPYCRFRDLMVDAFADSGERYDASEPRRHGRMTHIAVSDVLGKIALALERYPRSRQRVIDSDDPGVTSRIGQAEP